MKRFFFLIVCLFTLCSCGDPETSLVGQLDVTPIVNPNVGMLIESNNLAVTLTDEQTILGIGSGLIFETSDNFNSFQVSNPYENELTNIAYLTGSAIVCYEPPFNQFYDPITLYRTTNKGGTWKKSVIPNISNDVSRGFKVMKIQFINENQGFMMVDNTSYQYPSNTLFYKVNLDKSEAILVGRVDGYQPVEMQFLDANYGCVLLRSYLQNNSMQNTYTSMTTDGGITWSVPKPVDVNNRLSGVEIIDQNNLVVFEYDIAYHSDDRGTNWNQIDLSAPLKDLSFVNSSTGFSIDSQGNVSKSTNSGSSWSFAGSIEVPGYYGREFTNVHFYNEFVGIVYGRNQLYFTDDGGQTWDVLIFPFWYVTGE